MGAVIRMDSKQFVKKFKDEVDLFDYQFVLISELITTKDEFKNAKAIQRLIPPPAVVAEYINGNKQGYKKAYLQYLQHPNNEGLVSIIVQAAVVNDMKVVLLCSRSEDEFEYLRHLCEYIEAVYKLKTHTLKDYMKDPEKASKIKNKDEITKILGKKMERMGKAGIDLGTDNNKEKYIKELKKLGKKGMKKLAKQRGIKLKDDLDKDEMAKKLVKKLLA